MISRVFRAFIPFVVCGMFAGAFQARADLFVQVSDDSNGILDPDPVSIVTGQFVYWVDDGSGPYDISSFSGPSSFSTQTGGDAVQFTVPGHYDYVESGSFSEGQIIVSPNVPPAVQITNPTNNATLAAPATFDFTVNTSDTDPDGLSDVEFYVGTNLVDDVFDPGPDTTTVTNLATTVTNLAAGTYVLMAVAFDNVGATTTNTITIHVGAAAPILLSAPMMVAGKFQFNVAGLTVGKTNIVQSITNLASTNWVPLVTNVAGSTNMSFTNASANSRNFYRVVQLP
jgi:hypothetical protein